MKQEINTYFRGNSQQKVKMKYLFNYVSTNYIIWTDSKTVQFFSYVSFQYWKTFPQTFSFLRNLDVTHTTKYTQCAS